MVLMTVVLALTLSGPAQPPPTAPPDPQEQSPDPQEQKPDPQEQKADAKEPPTPPHTGIRALFGDLGEDFKHLPEMQNVYVATVGGVLALGVHPLDQSFNAKVLSHYDAVNTFFAPGKYLGSTPVASGFFARHVRGRPLAGPTESGAPGHGSAPGTDHD